MTFKTKSDFPIDYTGTKTALADLKYGGAVGDFAASVFKRFVWAGITDYLKNYTNISTDAPGMWFDDDTHNFCNATTKEVLFRLGELPISLQKTWWACKDLGRYADELQAQFWANMYVEYDLNPEWDYSIDVKEMKILFEGEGTND